MVSTNPLGTGIANLVYIICVRTQYENYPHRAYFGSDNKTVDSNGKSEYREARITEYIGLPRKVYEAPGNIWRNWKTGFSIF